MQTALKELNNRGFNKAYCWVLDNNPAIEFYEKSGAELSKQSKDGESGGQKIREVAYVWPDLKKFR